jgi:hypothetical protein
VNTIIKTKSGQPQAVVRSFADGSEALNDIGGNTVAIYDAHRDVTLDKSGNVIAPRNRLLSLLPIGRIGIGKE